ncbi:glycosyltransferase family 4 protein [Cyanobium sp. AMD-g]|nr:glycosyltransferase family 4 protein [Cyanobium sp. AMD-g]
MLDRIGWFGHYTGYEQLQRFLAGHHSLSLTCIEPQTGYIPRLLGKITSLLLGHGSINQAQAFARLKSFLRLSLQRRSLLHILYGDGHACFWSSFPSKLHSRTVLTFHQPPSQWTPEAIASLKWVRHAIVLYRKDLPFFVKAMPQAAIQFIPYGVDVDFFSPSEKSHFESTKRLLYNGVHLRNVAMMQRLVPAITATHPEVRFDFLVPFHRRDKRDFGDLLHHPSITWHAGLNDQSLLELYRKSFLLLLPMNDSGANTAVVEALACGLPVVTTDVGGIRDYGGGAVFPVVANNDDASMLDLVTRYLIDSAFHQSVSVQSRSFAEDVLDWSLVAYQHREIYLRVSESAESFV